MSSAIQNRLVGTIILVALAVIFLPDILDGKKQTNRELFVDLPQRPAMKPVVDSKAFPTEQVQEAAVRKVEIVNERALDDPDTSEMVASTEASATQSVDPAAEDLRQQTVVETDQEKLIQGAGWVVQLGVFRHQKNVKELLDKLEEAGYRGFSQPVTTRTGTLTKVFVGPDVDKSKLETALPHLKELTNLQGRLTPFTVK